MAGGVLAVGRPAAARVIVPGVRAIVSMENVTDEKYQINLEVTGPSTLISYGLPRTLRIGVEAFRN